MNTDALWPTAEEAAERVLKIQTKLHQWAADDPHRRFEDLDNLVSDPAFLVTAWVRVKGNRGARTAGVDGKTARYIVAERGEELFLADIRAGLKSRTFRPRIVRERSIPKSGGRSRHLGIPTTRDRVVQAALKLVLEPIFEADFKPCSYGFRPGRRAHDAVAEIHYLCTRSYEWIFEGDITACFDEIDHKALLDRVRRRIGDKRVVELVKAFLKAGILSEDGTERDTITGTPQGGILSPLLANIALSDLDEYFAEAWAKMTPGARKWHRRKGRATFRLVRYADDFVVLVHGTREHAEDLRQEIAAILQPIGLRLSEQKTRVAHVDEGFDFLGYRIQRHQKRGTGQRFIYTYPSKAALAAIKGKVRRLTQGKTNLSLEVLLHQINPVLRGWTNYFRYGVSKATLSYLRHFVWHRVVCWLRRKHHRIAWKRLRRRHLTGWWPVEGAVKLFDPGAVGVIHYRFRGARIPKPWVATPRSEGRSPA